MPLFLLLAALTASGYILLNHQIFGNSPALSHLSTRDLKQLFCFLLSSILLPLLSHIFLLLFHSPSPFPFPT